jgi:drug/metabolite transporter (DMT)-like permease
MKPPLKNFLTFIAALVVGVLLNGLNSADGFVFNPLAASAAVFGGAFCLFVFGRPREKPLQGQIGWGLLGLAAGLIAPFALLFMLLAG